MESSAEHMYTIVKHSPIHGHGVFASQDLHAGQVLFEYLGPRIAAEEADQRSPHDPSQPFHTFYFAISGEMVIDGDVENNPAKWINHSCTPNCQAYETDDSRVYIETLREIPQGEELVFDYNLVIDMPLSEELKQQYACHCGTSNCRGTMLHLSDGDTTKTEESVQNLVNT